MQKNNTAVQAGKPNKLADWPIRTLILSMGMPMVLSMVLQAVYNIVDTIFVSHMENGATAVLALTDSYSIQLLIVAVGVGTGIGINALLSKTLGERNFEKASCIAGNGIFHRNAGERECTPPGNGGAVSANLLYRLFRQHWLYGL